MKIMSDFAGLNALVTGGGRGIGAAIAVALTRGGAHVTILGRDEAGLAARVRAGDAANYIKADVADRPGFEAIMTAIAAEKVIDILVNNAGVAISAPFLKTSNADFQRMLDVNLLGPVIAVRAILPGMIARKFGRIVNIASTAALKGYPYVSAYAASKHALLGLTRAVAQETAKTGVTVNAVCPGFTDTDMVAAGVENIVAKTGRSAEAARAELAKLNPMGRLITPEEVAHAVCSLARPESAAITGAAIAVAGGGDMSSRLAYLDFETKVLESPQAHKDDLRLWLRLLTCTNLIEAGIRKRLADRFDTTLPRFDLLAQLDRAPHGMTLGDLSRRMMVTNGNITGLVERLVQSGHLKRFSLPNDRRVQIVKLTPKGQTNFSRIASAHEEWIAEFFAQLSPKDIDGLIQTLGKLKESVKSINQAPKP
jgi:3-hydroxybutyrate dehydrogenase